MGTPRKNSLILSLALTLSLLWLVLSGYFYPLLLILGGVSVVATLFLTIRMDLLDKDSHPIHLSFRLLKFWLKLGKKIIVANIDVCLRIIGLREVSPQLIRLPMDQSDDLRKVIYANAITLTPGSASIHIEDNQLFVHTISREGAEELLAGDMAQLIPDNPPSITQESTSS